MAAAVPILGSDGHLAGCGRLAGVCRVLINRCAARRGLGRFGLLVAGLLLVGLGLRVRGFARVLAQIGGQLGAGLQHRFRRAGVVETLKILSERGLEDEWLLVAIGTVQATCFPAFSAAMDCQP